MIRKWDTEDTAPLLALWLDSTIHAHPFLSAKATGATASR